MQRDIRPLILVAGTLLYPVLLHAQQPEPERPRVDAPAPVDSQREEDLAAGVSAAKTAMAGSLLARVARESPRLLRPAIDDAKAALAEQFAANPRALATARATLTILLLNDAPVPGLVEFEELRASPGQAPPNLLRMATFLAVGVYLKQDRAEPAARLARAFASDPEADGALRGRLCAMVAVSVNDEDTRREFTEKAAALGVDMQKPVMLMMQMSRGDRGAVDRMLSIEPAAGQEREWAAVTAVAAMTRAKAGEKTVSEGLRARLRRAMTILSTQGPPAQRFTDTVSFVGVMHEVDFQLALEAATVGEQLAARDFPGDEARRAVARLARAKILNHLGRTEELKAYADLDLNRIINVGWGTGDLFEPALVSKADLAPVERAKDR